MAQFPSWMVSPKMLNEYKFFMIERLLFFSYPRDYLFTLPFSILLLSKVLVKHNPSTCLLQSAPSLQGNSITIDNRLVVSSCQYLDVQKFGKNSKRYAPYENRTHGKCLEGIYVTTTPMVLLTVWVLPQYKMHITS